MIISPDHIKNFIKTMPSKNRYFDLRDSDFSFAYELQCGCGCIDFYVYKQEEPRVTAQCIICNREIVVYDLEEYPCASVYKTSNDIPVQVEHNGSFIFSVGIIFEYSDEFDFCDDEFNENDLTWCQIYLYDNSQGTSFRIINDETA